MPYFGNSYMGFDVYYLLLMLPALLISMWAQFRVKSAFNKYKRLPTNRGMTGYDAARKILDDNRLQHIPIERVSGNLTDHYDPRAGVIRLSDSVYGSASVAAVGVAAHEAGHAVQYADSYMPIRIRGALLPVSNIGSTLSMPLILIGLFAEISVLTYAGIALFSLAVLFQLVTLPVEFNASRRAIAVLGNSGMLDAEELKGSKKVLSAAALTYVAALVVSLLNLLRLILLAGRRSRR